VPDDLHYQLTIEPAGQSKTIVQNGGPSSRNKVRMAPCGVYELAFDSCTMAPRLRRAILCHDREARFVISNSRNLTDLQKNQLLIFLRWL